LEIFRRLAAPGICSEFWAALGRAADTFGFLEEMLGKAT